MSYPQPQPQPQPFTLTEPEQHMTIRNWTILVLIAVCAGLTGWDIFAVVHSGVTATISDVITVTAHKDPILAFALGLLCGHWFW